MFLAKIAKCPKTGAVGEVRHVTKGRCGLSGRHFHVRVEDVFSVADVRAQFVATTKV
jgi:hypothetical protein